MLELNLIRSLTKLTTNRSAGRHRQRSRPRASGFASSGSRDEAKQTCRRHKFAAMCQFENSHSANRRPRTRHDVRSTIALATDICFIVVCILSIYYAIHRQGEPAKMFNSQYSFRSLINEDTTTSGPSLWNRFTFKLSTTQRLICFAVCFGSGLSCFLISTMYIPFLLFKARKFCIFFSVGSLMVVTRLVSVEQSSQNDLLNAQVMLLCTQTIPN